MNDQTDTMAPDLLDIPEELKRRVDETTATQAEVAKDRLAKELEKEHKEELKFELRS